MGLDWRCCGGRTSGQVILVGSGPRERCTNLDPRMRSAGTEKRFGAGLWAGIGSSRTAFEWAGHSYATVLDYIILRK